MESIKLEVTEEKLKEALASAVEEVFKSSYRNPMVDMLTNLLKEKENILKEFLNGVITEVISKPEFREKMGDMVMQGIITKSLKN